MELIIGFILLIFFGHFISKKKYIKNSRYKRLNYNTKENNLSEKQIHYRKYLHTEHWKKTRARALSRANYKCEKCDCTKYLQVHHLNYNHL